MHPSPFALEQLLAGQASGEVTSHLLTCEACREQLSEMERTAQTFSASPRSLRAKDAAARADRRWKRRAAALTLLPAALIALLVVSTVKPAGPDQLATKPLKESSRLRQGRELLEPRQQPWRANLRSLPMRGHNVEFGQGSLEAALNDGPARPFTLQHTKVDIEVTGFMQAVTVTQTFNNPFTAPVEAIYVFPLPDDSAVHDMTMTAGSRVIRANIQKRAVARQQYEQAKAQGRRAALLDQERPNIFTQSVANLLPGEQVIITLQYVAPLHYDDGIYTLNFPMVVGPRYVPGAALVGESQGSGSAKDTEAVPDASRITPPAARSGRDIEVAVRLNAGTVIEDLWSVSHRLEVDRPSSSQMSLSLNPMDTLPNKDLIVRWRVSGTLARAAVLAAGGAFALMLNPESKEMNQPPTPKEMVFVIDTSCSMNGAPLTAAKRAMRQALEQMNPDDSFMLIDFADSASSFHDAPLAATPNDVRRAIAYLNALPSGGGTNQLAGIRRALARAEDPKRLRMVLLMTDGFIGNEEEILAETRKLRGDARVFGFGIGSSVNHFLLSRLSEEGRGFYQYLRPDEDAVEAVDRFTRRVARPLITDLSIDWGGLPVLDQTPAQAPDLFDVQPLIINGRYRAAGSGTVVLRGRRAGLPVVFEVPVTLPELSTDGHALQMAWARRRIEALSAVQYNEAKPEVVEQITSLGLEFHLVTKYTSLVAVDDAQVTGLAAVTVTEPTLLPDQNSELDGRFKSNLGSKGLLQGVQQLDVHGFSGEIQTRGQGGLGLRGTGAGGGGLGWINGRGRGPNNAPVTPDVSELPTTKAGGEDDFDDAFGSTVTKKPPTRPRNAGYIPPAPGAGVQEKMTLSTGDIMEVVLARKGALAKCVEAQRSQDLKTTGTLVMKWIIMKNGTTRSVEVASLEFRGTYIAACVSGVIKGMQFPRHTQQGEAVTFPFKF
ncbi:MAG: VIT domain-containing protein [Archangium sp.]|nr:VIT domain-containing protein [Archangium sp.]